MLMRSRIPTKRVFGLIPPTMRDESEWNYIIKGTRGL